VPGTNTWNTVTSSRTSNAGIYEAEWIPQATGNFTLKATWSGSAVQDPGDAEASLTSVASPGTRPIWIGSPTLAINPSFNSTTKTLSFILSPPGVVGSAVTIYVPKNLAENQPNGPLTVGGKRITYSV